MAPQRWRAGRGIRLNPRGAACLYPQRNVRILRLLESGVPDSRSSDPPEKANGSARTAVSGPA